MAVQIYRADKARYGIPIEPELVSFPYNFGNLSDGLREAKRFWMHVDDEFSLYDVKMKIEAESTDAFKDWLIAKEYNGRPFVYADYANQLEWPYIPSSSWCPFWIIFKTEDAEIENNSDGQAITITLTGETVA